MQTLGRIIAFAFGLQMIVNGGLMLVSPRTWFKLPGWFAPRGPHITSENYSSGWGGLELRLAGAVFLGVPIWAIYNIFFSR